MAALLRSYLRVFALLAIFFCSSVSAYASHIFGMDLYYSNVGGNVYSISLAVYGDCSGAAFYNLSTSSPAIEIYNGNTFLSTLTLNIQPPSTGIEVSPVCPAQAGNTTCTSVTSTLPGIKKFIYTGTVTLPGTSTVWRFLFNGNMGSGTSAGRSNAITNINIPGAGSNIQLIDTLNNVGGGNSSALYNTIPTPYFCINSPANYNPAAVDPNGDNLTFYLVPAIDASTGVSVNYVWPYNATAPLGVATGTFSFSNSNGQLSFTPNITQRADVVYNVRETISGVLKGTTQREMTVVVLSPCTNNPPTGSMSGASGGTIVSSTQLDICSAAGAFTFHINPTDADGDTISMTASGLPTGATFTVANNNTAAPLGTFAWNAATTTPGTYTFFINYQDRGCPLSSRQSIAYTVTVLPSPNLAFSLIFAATCTRKAVFTVTPGTTSGPWVVNLLQGATTVHTFTGVTGTLTDSLLPGTYTLRIYNSASCYVDTTISFASPPLPSATIVINPPLCMGDLNGFISVTGTAGVSPYQYALGVGTYSTSTSFVGLGAATYILHIKDANGCVKDTSVSIPNPTPIMESFIIRRSTCNGFANGRVIINAYNSIAPYTFAVGAGTYSTSDTFDNLAAGTYIFHIKNANGCIDDTTISFVDSQYLHASVVVAAILCNGGTAAVTVSDIGGFGAPYTYAYNTGAYGPFSTFTVAAGTFTFHVNDPQSCFFDTTITLTQPTAVTFTTAITNALCNGAADGSITISATGGTPPYVYAADAGAYTTSATLSGLTAGSHTVNVKDANGCIFSSTISISQPSPVAADSVSLHIPFCNGGNDGSITIHASGGTPSYTYAIGTGVYTTANTFSTLTSGTYTLHIKDANGCTKDTTVTLLDPPGMTPFATVTNSLCQNLSNGQVTITVTGGTPAYTYAMGSGAYTSYNVFAPLAAGSYTFHIKDAGGCVKDTTVTVINTTHVSGTFTITQPLCHGDANGVIAANGITGISPYTYALGTGTYSTVNTFNSLAAGTYTFHIADANGCIGDTSVSISQPTVVSALIAITQPACYGYNNGSVAVTATGGTPAYNYSLNNAAFTSTAVFTGLSAGIDTITVKDSHGCLYDTVYSIAQPMPITINAISVTNISCNGGANGMITITPSGGTPAYQYAANTGTYQASNTLTGLVSGSHIIHVRDSHGCMLDSAVILTQPTALTVTGATVTNPTCEGYTDGAITVNIAGGTAPYNYSKDNVTFYTSPSFSSLAEATYTIFVTDSHGCSTDTTITLIGYPHILADSFRITPASCSGTGDASIIIYGSGGNPSLAYALNGNSPTTLPNIFTGLSAGSYTATITDAKNCRKDSIISVPQPDTLKITTTTTPNDCIGKDDNGAVMAAVTGGTAPYTYLWSVDTIGTAYISTLPNGTYTVTVTDANNCKESTVAIIRYDNCCTPFLPNAFSPNGDGKNEVFRLGYKGDIEVMELSVYNRFGERVFFTHQDNQPWDGTYKNEPCDIGTYYYYVKFYCGNAHTKLLELKGDVTLVK